MRTLRPNRCSAAIHTKIAKCSSSSRKTMEGFDIHTVASQPRMHTDSIDKQRSHCSGRKLGRFSNHQHYSQLTNDDNDIGDCEDVTSQPHQQLAYYVPLLAVFMLLSLVLFTIRSLTGIPAIDGSCSHSMLDGSSSSSAVSSLAVPNLTPDPSPSTSRLLHCGNTTDQARALGCIFQIWSYAWVPSPCYDATLDTDFLLLQSGQAPPSTDPMMTLWPAQTTGWTYYADMNASTVVPLETVIKGESEVLQTTWLQHMWHCAYTWKKILRSLNGSGVKLTERDLSVGHTGHCSEMTVNAGVWGLDIVNDMLLLGFLECWV